jgi:hypothetical protein
MMQAAKHRRLHNTVAGGQLGVFGYYDYGWSVKVACPAGPV